MKIATWNLERAQPHTPQAEAQQQWIARINADLWIFTETHTAASPGAGYQSVVSDLATTDTPGDGRWVQIWVRDPGLRQV